MMIDNGETKLSPSILKVTLKKGVRIQAYIGHESFRGH